MKKTRFSLFNVAVLALAFLAVPSLKAAEYDPIKEDMGCCFTANVFCLAEKAGSDPTFCLTDEAKKDIGITDEQLTKIREFVKTSKEEIEKEINALKRPGKESTKEECAEYRKEMRKICEKHHPKCMANLEKILTREQIEKMQSRIFQYCGFVPNPIALEVLGLSGSQKAKIEEICEKACDKVHECLNEKSLSGPENEHKLHEKIAECRKDSMEKVKAVLSKEQIAKGENLLKQTPAYIVKMKEEHNPVKTATTPSSTAR